MYKQDNIFAKIINKDITAEVIYEDDKLIAFKDIQPVAPVHVLVIPKAEYIDYADFISKATNEEVKYFFGKINDIANNMGLEQDGYRLITNKGKKSGQSVFHFHFHIIGGKELNGLI